MLDLLVRDHQAWGDGPESKGPGGDQGQEEQEFEPRARRLRCMTHGKTSQAGSLGGIAQDQIVLKKTSHRRETVGNLDFIRKNGFIAEINGKKSLGENSAVDRRSTGPIPCLKVRAITEVFIGVLLKHSSDLRHQFGFDFGTDASHENLESQEYEIGV